MPDKVFLWKSAEDTKPITATFETVTHNWTITPDEEIDSWQKILEAIAYERYSDLHPDAYKNENKLLSLMLTKLHNDYPNVPWAKPREPFAEIFWQQTVDQDVKLSFLTRAVSVSGGIKTFKRQDGRWQKEGDIDLKSLNVSESPQSLRTIFALPPTSTTENDWAGAWHDFANTNFQGDSVRPIVYQDQSGKWEWILLEKKDNDTLPLRYVASSKPQQRFNEPTITIVNSENHAGMSWWETFKLLALLVVAALLIGVTVTVFFQRDELGKSLSRMIGGEAEGPGSKRTHSVIISTEGLNLLHDFALARLQDLPQKKEPRIRTMAPVGETGIPLDDDARTHLRQVFTWTHEQYLKLLNSDEFRERVATVDSEILAEQARKLGVEPEEAEKAKEWIALGRVFETTTAAVNRSDWVKEIIRQKHPSGLESAEDWVAYWPIVMNALSDHADEQQRELLKVEQRVKKLEKEQQSDRDKLRNELKAEWEGQLKTAAGEIAALKESYGGASADLEESRRNNSKLQAELKDIEKRLGENSRERELAQITLTEYSDVFSKIQEVQKLSRLLRQWIQSYFVTQQESTGEMRSVGLIAALVNYSLYQMCFSILEQHEPMKKAMAQNLRTFSKVFHQHPNFSAVSDSLKRIDPKVETVFDEPTNAAGPTIDDPLFQACLRSLKTETGFNLSPFFIDEKENMINVVNAS